MSHVQPGYTCHNSERNCDTPVDSRDTFPPADTCHTRGRKGPGHVSHSLERKEIA